MTGTASLNAKVSAMEDYPDWLHPLLVKDLRQNLQSGGFMIVFLWVHGSLALLVGSQALAFSDGAPTHEFSWLFWTDIVVIFCVLLPFRELFSGGHEMRRPAYLDLVRVTPMSTRSSIAGQRWRCGALLTCLLAVSVLPYVFLRYFVGEDLIRDLWLLLALLVDGLVLLSIFILLSGTRGVARSVLIALLLFGIPMYGGLTASMFFSSSSAIFLWGFVSAIAFMVSMALAIDVHQSPLPDAA